jgi:hypothetical protein
MPDHFAVAMPLMPSWSVAVAVVVLLAAGALHVSHARAARRFARWWHAAHVAMVFGMVVMFLVPMHGNAGLYGALAVVFGAVAAAMASALARLRVSGVDRRVWAASMADQALMVYMLLPIAQRPAALTYLAVAYLVAAAAAWLVVPERFTCMTPQRGIPVRNRPAPLDSISRQARPGAAVAVLGPSSATTTVAQRFSVRLVGNLTTGVRLTLMVMALAMAWMLLAMQAVSAAGVS